MRTTIAALSACVSGILFGQSVVLVDTEVPAVEDAVIRGGSYAGTALGGAEGSLLLKKASASYCRDFLLKFELPDISEADVSSAFLRLYLLPHDIDATHTLLCSVASNQWSEATVTWESAPASGSTIASVPIGSAEGNAWIELDVTNAVVEALAGTHISFRLKKLEEHTQAWSFHSRDLVGGNPPELKITRVGVPDSEPSDSPIVLTSPVAIEGSRIDLRGTDLVIENREVADIRFKSGGALRMSIGKEGGVVIEGDDQGPSLATKGEVRAAKLVVDADWWADFVFDSSYALPALEEVEAHIIEHGRLPSVPGASEVLAEGVSVGEMQALLLQKIEELTLYLLAQQSRMSEIGEDANELRSSLERIRIELSREEYRRAPQETHTD